MAGIELKLSVDNLITKKINLLDAKLAKAADDGIKKSAFAIQGEAKKLIQKGKRRGKIYPRGKRFHQASAPGEPPKSDTGRLVSSIRINSKFLESEVGTDLGYGQKLEEGIDIEKRPWLQRSFDAAKPEIDRIMQKVLNALMK